MENDIFWSETGSGFVEPGCAPPPRIPRGTPREYPPPPGNKFQSHLHLCFSIRANQALLFDGVDDHVLLPPIHTLGLTDRYLVVNSVTVVTSKLLRFLNLNSYAIVMQ